MLLLCRGTDAQATALSYPGKHLRHCPAVHSAGTQMGEGKADTRGKHNADNFHAGDVRAPCRGTDKFVGEHQRQLAGVSGHHFCKYLCSNGHSRMDNAEDYTLAEE